MSKLYARWQPTDILVSKKNYNNFPTARSLFLFPVKGTMQNLNRLTTTKPIIDFINYSLRGIGQVIFANNPLSGLLILLALFWQSPVFGLMGLWGVITSTFTAIVLDLERDNIRNGIYGYNGVLVGAAIANFRLPNNKEGFLICAIAVLIFSSLTTVLLSLITDWWAKMISAPILTLPFNIATLWFLIVARSIYLLNFEEPEILSNSLLSIDYSKLIAAVFIGFGQIFLADKLIVGIIIFIALAICTPIGASVGLLGSILGLLTGFFFAKDIETLYQGLWCYNSILTAIAIGGIFYVPNKKSFCIAFICAIFSAIASSTLSIFMQMLELPILTLPFCLITISAFIILPNLFPVLVPVSLHAITNPEEHRQRYLDVSNAIAIFRRQLELFMVGRSRYFWSNKAEIRTQMDLRYIFSAIDINSRNRVSIKKIKQYLHQTGQITSAEDLKYLIRFIDMSDRGTIDFKQFSELILRHQYLIAKQQTYIDYFLPINKNQHDLITIGEIKQAIASVGQIPPTKIQIKLLQQRTECDRWTWHQFIKVLLII